MYLAQLTLWAGAETGGLSLDDPAEGGGVFPFLIGGEVAEHLCLCQ